MANSIDSQQAQQLAAQFVKAQGKQLQELPAKAKGNGVSDTTATSAAAYYIYNAITSDGEEAGFVIISGDDSTPAVLGYTDQGSFSSEADLPEQVQAWLTSYTQQITALQSGTGVLDITTTTHTAVEPLLTTQWSQDEPYNNLAPQVTASDGTTVNAVTGCVATAISQVMRYHKWPQTETTAIPAYTIRYTTGSLTYDELPATTFDWDNMLDSYTGSYSDEEVAAVATLMRYTGQAVEMVYDESSSSATISDIPNALINYFDYSDATHIVSRDCYTIAQWDSLIYSEIAAGRPVIYSGSSSDVSHMFVCDGYDGAGLYHINWGWSGLCDGYYLLSVLRPTMSGIGGSATSEGYSISQNAVIGIKPAQDDDQYSPELFSGDYTLSRTGRPSCYIYNYSGHDGSVNISWAVVNSDGTLTETRVSTSRTEYTMPNYSYTTITYQPLNLSLDAGTYQLVPIYREVGTDDWQIASTPYEKFFITVKSNRSYSFEVQTAEATADQFAMGTPEWHTNMYASQEQHVTIPVTNSGSEYTGQLYLFYTIDDSRQMYIGDQTGVAIESAATEECVFFVASLSAGIYTLTLALDDRCSEPIDTFTAVIKEAPSLAYDIAASDITFTPVGDTSAEVTFRLTNNGTEPYVNATYLWLGEESETGSNYYYGSIVVVSEEELAAGETRLYTYTWEDLVAGNKYWPAPTVYTSYNGSLAQIGDECIFTFTPSGTGVGVVEADAADGEQWFTLSGVRMSGRPTLPGTYILNGKKVVIAK